MAKISTYPSADNPLLLSDRLIGTEAIRPVPSPTPLATKNFSLADLLQLFSANFPAASLQAVLNTGNTATQNITLTGTITTTLIKPINIEDTSGSQGLTFQVLSKGTSSINWVSIPVDTLQAVLNAGNTATQNITLIGDITSTKIIPGNIQDELGFIGTLGQFLSKTASGIRWVNTPAYATPTLGDVVSVGDTANQDIFINTLRLGKGTGPGSNNNTALGFLTLGANTTGLSNVGVGAFTLVGNTIGGRNTAVGYASLYTNISGSYNTSVGMFSQFLSQTGIGNVSLGYGTLQNNIIGNFNTAVGYRALLNSKSDKNTAIGAETMFVNQTGTFNTVLGQEALRASVAGSFNSIVGNFSLLNAEASYVSALGRDAGRFSLAGNLLTASESIFIGFNSKSLNTSSINEIVIGSNAVGEGDNTVTIGHTTITSTRLRGAVKGGSFVKDAGTGLQFLMADGTVTVGNGGVYSYEIHVSQVDGDDITGTGALLNPVATITKALTLITGLRKTIVIHPGNYTENPSITTQYTVLTTYAQLGGNTLITGTISTNTGCTISGLKMTNLNITAPTGQGNVNILNCDVSGTLTKSNTGDYTLIRFTDIGATNITSSAGLIAIFGGNPNFITINNAGARVVVKNAVTVAPVLISGNANFVDCIIIATTGTSNAITTSAGTIVTLANSQIVVPTFNNVARVSLSGFYSIFNTVFDKPNSFLISLSGTGGTTNSIDYFQFINADKFIKQGGTSLEYLMADGTVTVSPLTTKGDLYTFTTVGARLPVGLNTQVLLADSTTPTGLKWGTNTAPTPLGYYGAFSDVTDQFATVINTGYPMRLGVTDLSNGVTVVSNSRITIANTGIYNIQWSGQFRNPTANEHDITIWLRKNGVDVPGSSGIVLVPKKHGSFDGHNLPSWNYLIDPIAGDYYEFVWSTQDLAVFLSFDVPIPPAPSTASVIVTVTQQSGIMAGTGITSINSLTGATQTLTVGTTGTDFSIVDSGVDHKFNLPTASAINRGALSSADWSAFNNKQNTISLTTTGTSGAATLVGTTLNIPNYAPDLSGYVTLAGTQTITGVKTFTGGSLYINSGSISTAGTLYLGDGSITKAPGSGFTLSSLTITGTSAFNSFIDNVAGSALIPQIKGTGGATGIYWPNGATGTAIGFAFAGARMFEAVGIASGVNYLRVTQAIAASSPSLSAQGTDTNINLTLTPKGSGSVIISSTAKIGAATAPNASSVLDIESTTKGFLPPRMTTAQKNAIATPTSGLVVYDTTLGKLCVRGVSAWETITSI